MSYVDQNGLILLDENEAFDDINKLKSALSSLDEALSTIGQIASINSGFSGDTASMIEASVLELTQKINQQKNMIENEIKFISEVVTKYQTIDSMMKNQVNSTLS